MEKSRQSLANREEAPEIESAAGMRGCWSSLRSSPLKRSRWLDHAQIRRIGATGDSQVGGTGWNR